MNIDRAKLKKLKADAIARFEAKKKEALAHDAAIVERQEKKAECLEEMSRLQGEFRALDRLEKIEKGLSPEDQTLPTNTADRRGGKKK